MDQRNLCRVLRVIVRGSKDLLPITIFDQIERALRVAAERIPDRRIKERGEVIPLGVGGIFDLGRVLRFRNGIPNVLELYRERLAVIIAQVIDNEELEDKLLYAKITLRLPEL